ncbi:MAG: prepilin-type N-terminal cleavage/methylation domain-containing protein, partial [Deltaproteobacteria bacterium]|nr:prepilin-type N-terminal cleavage/methylation domain-containing protein [Deltaproteobacteria bacterium]
MEHLRGKNRGALHPSPQSDRGFTLIELLIAMAVGLVLLGAMYGVFTLH